MKTYSFNNKTIEQMKYLSEVLFLKPTSLIEFLINKAYNESKRGICKESTMTEDERDDMLKMFLGLKESKERCK